MKKIFIMLLGIAATINVMAVDYTAKAVVTLQAESGYTCELTLRQSNEYGALSGSEMYMSGRHVALYALNGTQPLEIAKATDLDGVKIGLKADASTNYTITVSNVAGTETLYLYDGADKAYALTEGASYNFTATANETNETRFMIKKSAPALPSICFNNNILEVTGYNGKSLKVAKEDGTSVVDEYVIDTDNAQHNLSAENGRLVVTLDGQEYLIDANLTPVLP